ncbi:fungal-specific transcription factor domain-domain-containing protein [Tuber borchii]|uniref:Fungal-specific transcription factor domain-domain-containing protein n=1 Tax=Tuber borchii TaxID=42251 RepID=A0A2T6ZL92_TUBBO|nr:fungal-specific transcription factor domain-domain-containing protein [Tuber borchii]
MKRTGPRVAKERKCHYCGKLFSKTEHLERHERSHTKDRPFQCQTCGKKYTRNDTLLRHSKSHNGGGSGVHSSANLTTGDLDGDKEEPSPISTSGTNFYSPSISPNFHENTGSYDSHTCGTGDHGGGGTGNFNSPSGLLSDPARHHDPMSMQSVDPTLEISPQNIPQGTLPGLHTSPSFVDPSLDDASPHNPNPTPFVTDADEMQINLVSTVNPGFDSGDQWAQALFAEPSWLIGQGFDFGALNASIIPGFSDINTNIYVDDDTASSVLPPPAVTALQESQNQIAVEYKLSKTNVAKLWFTSMDPSEENDEPSRPGSSSLMSPDREMMDAGDENSGVFDEQYRRRLSNQMKPKWAEEPLPSVDFLNLCVQMYFTKCSTLLPILHRATFKPTPENSFLLLTICTLGSLFIGSTSARRRGERIFERINKVILASWEKRLVRGAGEELALIQSSLIGQTYGLLSGSPSHLAIISAFHGTVISWARRAGMFQRNRTTPSPSGLSGEALERVWHQWVKVEEAKRTVLGLYIHDVELASMFHHEPALRHHANILPLACSTELFEAPTASAWAARYLAQDPNAVTSAPIKTFKDFSDRIFPSWPVASPCPMTVSVPPVVTADYTCMYTLYISLLSINAAACDAQSLGNLPSQDTFTSLSAALMQWHHYYQNALKLSPNGPQPCTFSLMALWHAVFLYLLVDINKLELAIGRDVNNPPSLVQEEVAYAMKWALTPSAKRAVIHGTLLQKQLANTPLDAEPAIHVPRALFHTGVVWYCWAKFAPQVDDGRNVDREWDEMEMLGVDTDKIPGAVGSGRRVIEKANLCALTDMLRRVGHWGIARRFARILGELVFEGGGNEW